MSNRPLPPIADGVGPPGVHNTTVAAWANLQAHELGLLHFDQASTGWETVLDVQGSGVLLWDIMTVKNASGSTRDIKHRLTIDGIDADLYQIALLNGLEYGFIWAGMILFEDVANLVEGCDSDYIPFETGLKIESYAETLTNLDMSVDYQYILT